MLLLSSAPPARTAPTLLDPELSVRPVITGLNFPTSIAFLGPDDLFVLEKNTGRVLRVTGGVNQGAVLDLAVNFGSERGLLGIALHPDFPANPGVYLYWTCRTFSSPANPFFPDQFDCPGPPALGADTDDLLQVPLLANRVDRFRWTGSSLAYEFNLMTLRAFQNDGAPEPPNQGDGAQPARGNHNAGVLRFGPDRKLYVLYGDNGRRGQLQNLPSGPTQTGLGPTVPDDQFGGPAPDPAHFTGVILRLNDDGGTPTDNPFFAAGAQIGGQVGANIQRVFAYGIRNSFGMAFDPRGGGLWCEENGEDAFDEINLVEPGMNGGWIQIIGPLSRVPEYRQIETTSLHNEDFPNLQQFRWGPERIATTPEEASSRLFVLPSSQYSDPEFSWKYVVAPAGLGFQRGRGLGPSYDGDMFMGLAVPVPDGGPLFHFNLTGSRKKIAVDDPRLEDRVADNLTFDELTESESLVIGRGFGIVTDIQTAPSGTLYIVSLIPGAIYEISRTTHGPKSLMDGGTTRESNMIAFATTLSVRPMENRRAREVRFGLGDAGHVVLTIHDLAGRTVARLIDGVAPAGEHQASWAVSGIAPGVYFVRLELRGRSGQNLVRLAKVLVTN
jgi:glucose/arabinose dehydrogenase